MEEQLGGIVIPSNPEARKEIQQVIEEISNAKLKIESKQEYIRDAIADVAEKHDLPKKIINKLAVAYHKNTIQEVAGDTEDLVSLYDILFGNPSE